MLILYSYVCAKFFAHPVIHRNKERQTDRQIVRLTERQTERQRSRLSLIDIEWERSYRKFEQEQRLKLTRT